MKKVFLIFILSLIVFSFALNVLAQGRDLEIDYPDIPGAQQPQTTAIQVPEYVKYIVYLLISLGGIIALFVLINAGLQYVMSAGNPEKLGDAKNKITAALLGLLILFGSVTIIYTINPDFLTIELQRLRPIISELAAGVWLCQERVLTDSEEDAILRAGNLTHQFITSRPDENRDSQIQQELNILLDKIALKCYLITGAGDVRSDLDNKINFIYFIPLLNYKYDERSERFYIASSSKYGAAVYEETKYKGRSKTFFSQAFDPAEITVEQLGNLNISSIKPFVEEKNYNWRVRLYEDYNYNQISNTNAFFDEANMQYYGDKDTDSPASLEMPPKSMKIEGQALVVLFKGEESEAFFSEFVSNLEMYHNIVKWEDCEDYESDVTKKCEKYIGGRGAFGGGPVSYDCCAKAAATEIIILSAKPY